MTSDEADIREALAILRERADEWVKLPPLGKAGLIGECIQRLTDVAPAWVAAGIKAKHASEALAGEEWLSGPVPTVRLARLLRDSLEALGQRGAPPLGTAISRTDEGRLAIEALPTSVRDRAVFAGFRGTVICEEGIDEARARALQAAHHREGNARGAVVLILGAGNVSSIPPMDVLSKLCVENKVCLLKMNPVNEWLGPFLSQGLYPLIARGFVRMVFGGAEVGAALCEHPAVDEIHITGSDKTHDRILWGDGEAGEKRRAANTPRTTKPLTSELGNVSPVAIVPGPYTDEELAFQAKNVVTMVTNNASFNCNAAKLLITAPSWPQRTRFFKLLAGLLASVPPRHAYYPGARDRYEKLLVNRQEVEKFGSGNADRLPWALIRNVDPRSKNEPLFSTEPFCGLLSDVPLGSSDPVEFLHAFTQFANDVVWGTLNACIIISRDFEREPVVSRHLRRAIHALRYGTVAINHWPAVGYASGSLPWGGHPSATAQNIQSGIGWVHNSFMLGGIEKVVLRGPLTTWPSPPWFYDHPHAADVGRSLLRLESGSGFRGLPALAWNAIRR